MEITTLPDLILLELFKHLPVKERCIVNRVCKRWKRVANDNSLWRHVDLSPYKLDLKKSWKVIRSHLSDCLLTMKIRGYVGSQGPSWNKPTFSNAILEDLRDRCPNIYKLHLLNVCIDSLDSSKLPQTITKLTLQKCSWPKAWMKNCKLPGLQSLKLTNTSRIDNTEIEDFIKFTHLEELSLSGCYRVKEAGLKNISENLTSLRHLDISDTDCTDLALHHISRNMKHLNSLSLAACKPITNGGVASVSEGLTNLESLDISNCPLLDENCLKGIYRMKDLRKLKHTLDLPEENMKKIEIYFQNKPLASPPIF